MTDSTSRFALPYIAVAQAQKEMTHNEALEIADLLIAPVVEAVAPATVPPSPVVGQGWIVGPAPTGAWDGQAGNLAFWTNGGWRFVVPRTGMEIWSLADDLMVRRTAIGWESGIVRASMVQIAAQQVVGSRLAAVADPVGGSVIDTEARAAVAMILQRLRTHGLIAA